MRFEDTVGEMFGSEPNTTNNRMELRAFIAGLNALKERCEVEAHTDSQYVQRGVSEWLAGWKQRGWKTAGKKPVANQDLWMELDAARERHRIRWHWVKGKYLIGRIASSIWAGFSGSVHQLDAA